MINRNPVLQASSGNITRYLIAVQARFRNISEINQATRYFFANNNRNNNPEHYQWTTTENFPLHLPYVLSQDNDDDEEIDPPLTRQSESILDQQEEELALERAPTSNRNSGRGSSEPKSKEKIDQNTPCATQNSRPKDARTVSKVRPKKRHRISNCFRPWASYSSMTIRDQYKFYRFFENMHRHALSNASSVPRMIEGVQILDEKEQVPATVVTSYRERQRPAKTPNDIVVISPPCSDDDEDDLLPLNSNPSFRGSLLVSRANPIDPASVAAAPIKGSPATLALNHFPTTVSQKKNLRFKPTGKKTNRITSRIFPWTQRPVVQQVPPLVVSNLPPLSPIAGSQKGPQSAALAAAALPRARRTTAAAADPRSTDVVLSLHGATSNKLKTFRSTLQWGTYTYTVTQNLPDSTTDDEWNKIVENYTKILENHKDRAGVPTLSLNFDKDKKTMKLNIPNPSGTPTIIDAKGETSIGYLIDFYTIRNIGVFATTSTEGEKDKKTSKSLSGIDTHTLPLENKGNTCFIASVCQGWLIFQKNALQAKLNHLNTPLRINTDIGILITWIEAYENGKADLTPLLVFIKQKKPEWYNETTGTFKQQDAHEFIDLLNEFMIHEPIFTHSEYTYESALTVVEDPKSLDRAASHFLSLGVEKKPIDELVKQFFNPMTKDLNRKVVVEKDRSTLEEVTLKIKSKQDRFTAAPQELNIQFKRFDSSGKKLDTEIEEIQEILELSGDYFVDGKPRKYQLDSVIEHLGDKQTSGHYIAYVRKVNPKKENEFYFVKANDGEITNPIPKDEFLKAAKRGYLLRYTQVPIL